MRGALNRNVVALGMVSLFTDVSSEMILPILPLFVTGVLGASTVAVGWIEGVAESVSSLLRVYSGRLSDRIQQRKPFLVAGYGVSGVAKAALALAGSWGTVLALRAGDRVGKALRNPARDALIADSVPPASWGAAFGLHGALDTAGAAIGPLVAWALLEAMPGDYRRVFAVSLIPAALSVLVLLAFVRAPRPVASARPPVATPGVRPGPALRRFLLVAGLFSLANSSIAFVILRGRDAGLGAGGILIAYCAYNVCQALCAWPAGAWTDRIGRRPVLLIAYVSFVGVYALLALRGGAIEVILALLLLGVHHALLQVSQRAMIADLVPSEARATAYGAYYTVVGLALLPASLLTGWLWDLRGPGFAFGVGAGIAAVASVLCALLLPAGREHEERHAQPA